jgi:hypothetical protein
MNKKVTHLFFAFILTIATLIPMFPQQAQAQSAGDVTFAGQQFNRRVIAFNRILARAQASLPEARLLLITSVALGISTEDISLNFVNLGLPSQMNMNDFILVLVISRSANISVQEVINALGTTKNFGLVITSLGIDVNSVNFRSLLFRINGLMADLEAEISIQLGQTQLDSQFTVANLELSLSLFRERFNRFDNRIANFNAVFAEILIAETSLTLADLVELRAQFPNLSDADLSLMALILTSINGSRLPDGNADFIVGGVPMDNLDADVIFKLFEQRGIPVFAFGSRLDAFTRRMNLIMRNPPAVDPIGIEINPFNNPQSGF